MEKYKWFILLLDKTFYFFISYGVVITFFLSRTKRSAAQPTEGARYAASLRTQQSKKKTK